MLDIIPNDVFLHIMEFVKPCKKDCLYINKHIFGKIKPIIKNCEPIIVFKRKICKNCNKKAIDSIKSFQYLV